MGPYQKATQFASICMPLKCAMADTHLQPRLLRRTRQQRRRLIRLQGMLLASCYSRVVTSDHAYIVYV